MFQTTTVEKINTHTHTHTLCSIIFLGGGGKHPEKKKGKPNQAPNDNKKKGKHFDE